MEKRDIMVIVAAIVVVLIMAVVVKPMLTGEPVTFLPEGTLQSDELAIITDMIAAQPIYTPMATVPFTPIPTVPPAQTIPPAPIPTAPVGSTWQPDPENPMPNIPMTKYAEIVGRYTGLTEHFVIPVPYWEVQYELTYDPTKNPEFSIDVHEIKNGVDAIIRTMTFKVDRKPDPSENRFYAGGYTYYITVHAKDLAEYRMNILVPSKYIQQ
jgi:hypothetical protein